MEVLWSPYEDSIFARLTVDNLTLFQVDQTSDRTPTAQSIELSARTRASPLVTTQSPFFVRCIDWCPTNEFGRLLAVGFASGRVRILGFQEQQNHEQQDYAQHGYVQQGYEQQSHEQQGHEQQGYVQQGHEHFRSFSNREFGPRHSRPCNAVAWNPTDCNLIAAGLDRHRNDSSLLIYDLFTTHDYSWIERNRDDSPGASPPKSDGALFEFGAGDQVVSLAWFYSNNTQSYSKTILGGFQNKGLRIFDLRADSSNKPRGPATKAVYGACMDPFGEHRVASYCDNVLNIWDVRSFEKPIAVHEAQKAITAIRWSPTRYGLLAMSLKESADLRLLDVQHAHVTRDEYEPVLLERSFIGYTDGKAISSFSWHPKNENRVLIATASHSMYDVKVLERITLNWSRAHHLLWACGREIRYLTDQSAPELILRVINDDISVRMKQRATNGYGMNVDKFSENAALLAGDARPEALWSWLDAIRNVEGLDSLDGLTFRGTRNILLGATGKPKTEPSYAGWDGVSLGNRKEGVPVYTSNDRDHILRLCGWSLNKDSTLESLLSQDQYERAVALCVFHFDLRKAIEILQSAAKRSPEFRSFSIVAVALSGFTDDQPSLWRSLSATITPDITQPYLRATFLFLSSGRSEATLKRIAADNDLILEDRIAFACTFFNDALLQEYMKDLSEDFSANGVLEGLVVTGFGTEGIDLIQNYIDKTNDVQTASLLTALILTKEWAEDSRPYRWVDDYREVLDSWMLWEARATFDVHNNRLKSGGPRIPRQIVATCTFCGKSIAHSTNTQSVSARGEKLLFPKTPNVSEIPKVMACSSCGKSLPRCALCQIHMGTPTNMGFVTGEMDDEVVKRATKINPIEKWFTWCQSCRHGGHAAHLAEWFKDHSECAVTGCSCKCMMIESGCATITNSRRRIATSN